MGAALSNWRSMRKLVKVEALTKIEPLLLCGMLTLLNSAASALLPAAASTTSPSPSGGSHMWLGSRSMSGGGTLLPTLPPDAALPPALPLVLPPVLLPPWLDGLLRCHKIPWCMPASMHVSVTTAPPELLGMVLIQCPCQ